MDWNRVQQNYAAYQFRQSPEGQKYMADAARQAGLVNIAAANLQGAYGGGFGSGKPALPMESARSAILTGSSPTFTGTGGETYFLKQTDDTQSRARELNEMELARRAGRPYVPTAPTYHYETAGGQRLAGTFLGEGGYEGFGRFATDQEGKRLARYSPQIMARRAARGQDPYGPQSTGTLEAAGRGLGPVLPRSQRERQLAGVGQAPSTSMGMAGSELAFTGFGRRSGVAPQPTTSFTPPAPSPFNQDQLQSSTRFGGYGSVPQFPFAGKY